MSQLIIDELAITPTTLRSALKAACDKWNEEHPNQNPKETVHSFLVNILTYWKIVTYQQYKTSELAEELAELYRDGTPGYGSHDEETLMGIVFSSGVVQMYVEDSKTLPQLLQDHPWILYQD